MYGKAERYAKCTDEQSFKMMYLSENRSMNWYQFCIETEETVKGFPDVLAINRFDLSTVMYEFKFTKTGKIKFQPTQPAFYKSHPELAINIVAYNAKTKCLHFFGAGALFLEGRYKMNEKAEVDLCKVEKLMKN